MTWDWIADTLYMIEVDLRERSRLCPAVAKRDTEACLSHVSEARRHIVDAYRKMDKAREKAMAERVPGEGNDDIPF